MLEVWKGTLLKMPSTHNILGHSFYYFLALDVHTTAAPKHAHRESSHSPLVQRLISPSMCFIVIGSRKQPPLPLPPTRVTVVHTFLWNEKRWLKCQTQPPSQSIWSPMRTRRRASITPRFESWPSRERSPSAMNFVYICLSSLTVGLLQWASCFL